MPHVSLNIHLRLFPLGRRGQRDDAENARADAFGDRLDDPALAGAVAALEYDANLEPLGDDPELQLDQFGMQPRQFALIGFASQLVARRGAFRVAIFLARSEPSACASSFPVVLYNTGALA